MSQDSDNIEQQDNPKIKFHFVKSNNFRVIHVDGVFGGMTPRGQLSMGVFSERIPFPDFLVHEFDESNGTFKEIARTGRDGVLREIEASLVMDIDVAEAFSVWLLRHIDEVRTRSAAATTVPLAEQVENVQ